MYPMRDSKGRETFEKIISTNINYNGYNIYSDSNLPSFWYI